MAGNPASLPLVVNLQEPLPPVFLVSPHQPSQDRGVPRQRPILSVFGVMGSDGWSTMKYRSVGVPPGLGAGVPCQGSGLRFPTGLGLGPTLWGSPALGA